MACKAPQLSGRVRGSPEGRGYLLINPSCAGASPSLQTPCPRVLSPGASATGMPASVARTRRAGWPAGASTAPQARTASAACPSSRTARGRGARPRPPTSVYVSVPGLWGPEAGAGVAGLGNQAPSPASGWAGSSLGLSPPRRDQEELRESWTRRLVLSPCPHTQSPRPSLPS